MKTKSELWEERDKILNTYGELSTREKLRLEILTEEINHINNIELILAEHGIVQAGISEPGEEPVEENTDPGE